MIKKISHRGRGICILFLCLIWVSLLSASRAHALSVQEEMTMGQEFLVQIRKNFELVEDDFANQFINELGQYLLGPLETKTFPFRFYLIKDPTLNAFAAPGGHIFIFSGLIEAMDNADELAAVICHEIGHVSARHLAQRIEQSKKIGLATMASVLAAALIGGQAAAPILMGSMAAGLQTQLHYSREDERQADQLGFKYMETAGFDPRGMITTLKKIEKGSWLGTDRVPAYLLTHPTGPERMANLDSLLSSHVPASGKDEALRFESVFPFVRALLIATCLDPDEAKRRLGQDLDENPDSAAPHFGLGIAHMETSEFDAAIGHFKIALEENPDSVPILNKLAEAYQLTGRNRESLQVLERSLTLDEENRTTLFLLGLTHENLGNYQKAISLMERLAAVPPVSADVYYHLGLCYGRENRLALAHFNFGVHSKKSGKIQEALFHFRKASELSSNDPVMKRKIGEEMGSLLQTKER